MSDTSVLIDLDRGGILHEIFKLPFEVGVPDLLYERELKHWPGPALEAMGLRVLSLDGAGVSLGQSYRARERRLSLPDAFALALAKTGGHLLLDRPLSQMLCRDPSLDPGEPQEDFKGSDGCPRLADSRAASPALR